MQVKQEKKRIRQFFLGLTTSNMHQLHAGNDVVCLTLAVRLMKPYVVSMSQRHNNQEDLSVLSTESFKRDIYIYIYIYIKIISQNQDVLE